MFQNLATLASAIMHTLHSWKIYGKTMKKLFFFLFFLFSKTFPFPPIETERTLWQPWTIEHTQEWETIEQLDISIAYFYRNDFLEAMDELIQRDSHWLTLCTKIESNIGTMMLFPPLGFAIIDKIHNKLIGIIRMKLCNTPGQLSFGFALRPDMRNQHLGREILSKLIQIVNTFFTLPIARFKQGITKQMFMNEWYYQGKQSTPDFDHLLSFFDTQPYPFETLIGSVDIMNPASLSVLLRNNMEPFSIVCHKYIIDESTVSFSCDFLLRYPAQHYTTNTNIKDLVADMLSRDSERIDNTLQFMYQNFEIPPHAHYLSLKQTEKALFNPQEKIVLAMTFTHSDTTRTTTAQRYYPPYCFIK